MQVFTDHNGKRWQVELDIDSAKRCRDLAGVNIYKLAEDRFRKLGELLADPVSLADALYCLSTPLDGQPATDRDFGRALKGVAVERAIDAFCKELPVFFHTESQRKAIELALQGWQKLQAKLEARAEKEMAAIDLEKITDEALAKLEQEMAGESPANGSNPSSAGAPASSASTPAAGPSMS